MFRWMPFTAWFYPKMIRWIDRAINFLISIRGKSEAVAKHDHDLSRFRLSICEKCPIYSSGMVCDSSKGGCGCFMPIKARFAGAKCPTNRW